MTIFEQGLARPLFGGEASVDDLAIGQEVEIIYGESPDVRIRHRMLSEQKKPGVEDDDEAGWTRRRYVIEVSNAGPSPVTIETDLPVDRTVRLARLSRKVTMKGSRRTWIARLPAQGRASLSYEIIPGIETKYDWEQGDDDRT
jgi:hypothetical protein